MRESVFFLGAVVAWLLVACDPDTGANVVASECGNGIVEHDELCEPELHACCNATCDGFLASDVVCRDAAGDCDVEESCTGSGPDCPADVVLPEVVLCRAASGACYVEEFCDGESGECPVDEVAQAAVVCRGVAGACDLLETCNGSSKDCPVDSFASTSVECRAAAGTCDVAETCTGTGPDCPDDEFASASVECRAAPGACDLAEYCTGSGPACPADVVLPVIARCRVATGDCDLEEFCDGASADCPADDVAADTVVCRPPAGDCDVEEKCDGATKDCPVDAFALASVECRAANSAGCDVAEMCPGNGPDCPADVFEPNTTECRAALDTACDVAEFCTGSGAGCPPDQVLNEGQTCSVGPGTDNGTCSTGLCCPGDTTNTNQLGCLLNDSEENDLVFVSHSMYPGNLGEISDYDAACTAEAAAANLAGSFRALMSDSTRNAADVVSEGPFWDVSGVVVSLSALDLFAADLLYAIDLTQYGTAPSSIWAWTGSDGAGQATGFDCSDWSSDLLSDGTAGRNDLVTNPAWLQSTTAGVCAVSQPIYCFKEDCPGVPDVDFDTDVDHCGSCDNACDPGGSCMVGVCCPPGVDLLNDNENCGTCGNMCGLGTTCTRGACFPDGALWVFLSSGDDAIGSMGSVANIDALCQAFADNATPPLPGTFRAWVSDYGNGINAKDRVEDALYANTHGDVVADNLADLIDSSLDAAIRYNENGAGPFNGQQVWTGTDASGMAVAPSMGSYDCDGWNNASETGTRGNSGSTSATWTDDGTGLCNELGNIYCFEVLPP